MLPAEATARAHELQEQSLIMALDLEDDNRQVARAGTDNFLDALTLRVSSDARELDALHLRAQQKAEDLAELELSWKEALAESPSAVDTKLRARIATMREMEARLAEGNDQLQVARPLLPPTPPALAGAPPSSVATGGRRPRTPCCGT